MTTIDAVTPRERNESGAPRVHGGARLRDGDTGGGAGRLSVPLSAFTQGAWWAGRWEQAKAMDVWHAQSPSLADTWDRTRRGDWVAGDHPWWIEAPGYVFGAAKLGLIAVLLGLVWMVAAPARGAGVALLCLLLWITW